jgi:hypothetical protein
VNDQAWTPRRGAPAAREGESREQYTKRIRAERNRRHRDSVKARAWAASPAGKLAAAAAKPRPNRNEPPAAPAREREPAYLSASVLTNSGRYNFDTADPAEIARIEAILRSEPGLEQLDPTTLHAALTRIAPGTTLSLTDPEPHNPEPSRTE